MKKILVISSLFTPFLAMAQTIDTTKGVVGIAEWFSYLLNLAFPILIALAVVVFVFNVFKLLVANTEDDKGTAKKRIGYGLLGIAIMSTVWLLVYLLTSTLTGPTNVDVANPVGQICIYGKIPAGQTGAGNCNPCPNGKVIGTGANAGKCI